MSIRFLIFVFDLCSFFSMSLFYFINQSETVSMQAHVHIISILVMLCCCDACATVTLINDLVCSCTITKNAHTHTDVYIFHVIPMGAHRQVQGECTCTPLDSE